MECKRAKLSHGNCLADNENKENAVDSSSSVPREDVHLLMKLHPRISKKKAAEALDAVMSGVCGKSWGNWSRVRLGAGEGGDVVDYLTLGCLPVSDCSSLSVSPSLSSARCHSYTLNEEGPLVQTVSADENSEGIVRWKSVSTTATAGSTLWHLPCVEFEDIWSSLVYDDNIKNELLSYLTSLIDLSERGVDQSVISVNRLILLLGPPGTGKTSLCKALAQLASVLLASKFQRAVMVEVNSHCLFSKWFSESGKLVGRLFEQTEELAADPSTLVFLLIDEAESLCSSRARSSSGDPSDGVRAVNALLTNMDKLRRYRNVFVMCTSNLADSLDAAFMDRADVARVVGIPGEGALTAIYRTCLHELQRIGVMSDEDEASVSASCTLLARRSLSLSARAARQIPAVAWAKAVQPTVTLSQLIPLLERAIDEKKCKHANYL